MITPLIKYELLQALVIKLEIKWQLISPYPMDSQRPSLLQIMEVPLSSPSNFKSHSGNGMVSLFWINPTDSDFDVVKIYRSLVNPASSNDLYLIYSGSGTSYDDTNVTNGVTYYYFIFSYDDSGNESSNYMYVSGTPNYVDTTPPSSPSNFNSNSGNGMVSLSWNNPTDSDFDVVKIYRSLVNPASSNDLYLIYSGSAPHMMTNVTNGVTYYYFIFHMMIQVMNHLTICVSGTPKVPSLVCPTYYDLQSSSIYASDGTYLGDITYQYNLNSIFNEFGTYGSSYSLYSIWNEFGSYGGSYNIYSPFNQYTSYPPAIYKNGLIIGYLTINNLITCAVNPYNLLANKSLYY